MISYFRLLELPPDASEADVEKAYHQLHAFWDPTRFSDNVALQKKATRKRYEINHAYQSLKKFDTGRTLALRLSTQEHDHYSASSVDPLSTGHILNLAPGRRSVRTQITGPLFKKSSRAGRGGFSRARIHGRESGPIGRALETIFSPVTFLLVVVVALITRFKWPLISLLIIYIAFRIGVAGFNSSQPKNLGKESPRNKSHLEQMKDSMDTMKRLGKSLGG